MRLDQTNIAIRPRSLLESMDLAAFIVRRHWPGVTLAAAIGIVPFFTINQVLFRHLPPSADTEDQFAMLTMFFGLVFLEIPWATAFVTLYLGQITFLPKFSAKNAARDFFGSFGQLLVFQTLIRGLCVVVCVLLPVVALGFRYLNEIILLERTPFNRTFRRRGSISERNTGRIFGHLVFDLIVVVLFGGLLTILLVALSDLWNDRFRWAGLEYSESLSHWNWEMEAALWLVVVFLVILRFITYLDCRIRREGWDVELKFRTQARAMKAGETW